MTINPLPPTFSSAYPNLALERLGARIDSCSDEFFAPAIRCLDPSDPIFIPAKYDDHGKWMDGWETRRRRSSNPDHDWLVLSLGAPALLEGVNLCTRHFTGNYPPHASLEASSTKDSTSNWTTVIPTVDLGPDQDNWYPIDQPGPWRHLRLKIRPDGGIARLRVYGQFVHDLKEGDETNLTALLNGARIVGYSDAHFGVPTNMLMPDAGINMGDGWETARRRGPGHDWALIALGCAGTPARIVIDTAFYKGNYPASCDMQATWLAADTSDQQLRTDAQNWPQLTASTTLGPDCVHEIAVPDPRKISHLLLNIYPDGGVSRLRVYGSAQP